jgi:hypothetical protein
MPLDPTARSLADLVHQSQTVQQATAPSGGRAGQTISLRVGGRPLQARCLVSFGPGPVVAVLTGQGWACLPVAATRQVGVRPVEFRQRRGGVVPVAGDAAVLYSVVNGAVREFWVKTGSTDVKVFEIDNEKTLKPEISWGDLPSNQFEPSVSVSASATFSDGPTTNPDILTFTEKVGEVTLPVGTSVTLASPDVTATLLALGSARNIRLTSLPFFDIRPGLSFTSGSDTVGTTKTVFESGTFALFVGQKARRIDVGLRGTIRLLSTSGGAASVSVSCSTFVGSYQIFNRVTPYESWLSVDVSTIYVTIKYLEEFLFEDDPETEFDSYDKLALVEIDRSTGTITTEVYDIGDSVPAQEGNWRSPGNNFRLAENTDPTGNNCLDAYLPSKEDLLKDDKLYTIALDQVIDDQSLQTRLQASPDTVTATFTTRTATDDGDTCTLGDEQTSTVQVPSPGRGNVEGITYLPP